MDVASKRLAMSLPARVAWVLAGLGGVSTGAYSAEVVEERIATEHLDLRLERVASGLEHPWAMAMLPDGRFLVSERPGRLVLIGNDGEPTQLEGIPEVNARTQGGLLDVSLHPRYGDGEHDWIYFTWSKPGDGGTATALSRARLGDARLEDLETLFEQNRYSDPGRHYGSRLAWLEDGTLAMSIGDRGDSERAQDGGDHAGSVLRLTDDGEVPDDNPFVDDNAVADEIYSMGNRNPQGLAVASDGTLWATEHGPRTGDELNRIEPGENYGWPEVSLGFAYSSDKRMGRDSAPGMRDPAYVFEGRFAPAGLAQVTSEAFTGWQGDLLAGGLLSERLLRLSLENGQVVDSEVILDGEIGRIRDVRQGWDDAIYLLSDDTQGSLYRLSPVQ
ncbi:PQQ-dependent sugar dehydrogenase [Billgrantia saliphila]|uniref:PQQ-dependent sugar dehydrogenase n=1 Tax=Billgrantia saliphila TaxID=1848458 RepID=UPI000CE4A858|nr:PQQ-dependent sugar dehydrogenase [Halomonas saliphila]